MKRKYQYKAGSKTIEREYNYIPGRYILAVFITLLEMAAIIGSVIAICVYVPYFYLLCYVTAFGCIIKIIASDDNPEYKVPWVFFVLVIPIAGFMLYFLFYSRKLEKKFVRRLSELERYKYKKEDDANIRFDHFLENRIEILSVRRGCFSRYAIRSRGCGKVYFYGILHY